eukprot:6227890-Karenia_brevis.AAC.1
MVRVVYLAGHCLAAWLPQPAKRRFEFATLLTHTALKYASGREQCVSLCCGRVLLNSFDLLLDRYAPIDWLLHNWSIDPHGLDSNFDQSPHDLF